MIEKRTILAWTISILFALFSISFVIQLVDEAGTPILLDPKHKLEIPPPPKSMYQMGKEARAQPSLDTDSEAKNSEEQFKVSPQQATLPSKKDGESLISAP